MFPFIEIGTTKIPTFSLCALVGVLTLVFSVFFKLRKRDDMTAELYFIIPKLFIALGFGFCGSIFFDALFKIPENGGFKLSGIMFYGGLISGFASLLLLLRVFGKNSSIAPKDWLEILVVPFILFHALGRIGCFLGGCCYGKPTNNAFGMMFPDNPDAGIFHYGQAAYPTQLYEAIGLFALASVLHFSKRRKFDIYCIAYPTLRFMLEFLRGDNRGAYIAHLSPAQFLSLLIVICFILYKIIDICTNTIVKNDGFKNV